jgi:hypothetical protein
MHRRPWAQPKGYLPSDRIKSKYVGNASKNKRNQQSSELPKSREVKRLESLIQAVRDANEDDKDPKGGCFCLGKFPTLNTKK